MKVNDTTTLTNTNVIKGHLCWWRDRVDHYGAGHWMIQKDELYDGSRAVEREEL